MNCEISRKGNNVRFLIEYTDLHRQMVVNPLFRIEMFMLQKGRAISDPAFDVFRFPFESRPYVKILLPT
jgi:hypothetical protein